MIATIFVTVSSTTVEAACFSLTGGIIMFGGLLLFDQDFIHVVSITFTALILTELLMVALTIRMWHWLMLLAEVISLALYVGTLAVLKNYFGKLYMKS